MNIKDNKEKDILKSDLNQNSIEESKSDNSKIILNSKLDLNKISLNQVINENLLNFKGDYFKKLYEEAEKEERKEFKNEFEIHEDMVLKNKLNNNDIKKDLNKNIKENNDVIETPIKKEKDNLKLSDENEVKKDISNNEKKKSKKSIKNNSKSDNSINYTKIKNHNLLTNNNNIINPLSINHIFKINIIYFEMKYDTQMGENISVIGSIDKLGEWNLEKALNLNWNEGNIWIGSLDYKKENDFEYKFILVNNENVREWENGINRKFIFQQIKSLMEPQLANGNIIRIKNIMNQTLEYDYNNLSLKIISNWNLK